jgi:hypothetical protein
LPFFVFRSPRGENRTPHLKISLQPGLRHQILGANFAQKQIGQIFLKSMFKISDRPVDLKQNDPHGWHFRGVRAQMKDALCHGLND